MKVVAVVPIKLNNERLPGKNTMLLSGRPLIAYCLETLLSVSRIDEITVYCSSDKISAYLPEGVAFLKRPENLDLPTANFTQIFTSLSSVIHADIYVYAHATAPFVKAATILNGLNAVVSGEYDSAFCAERIQDFLWSGGEPLNFDAGNMPRSQDLPVIFRETSGVYIFTKQVFETCRRRIGRKPLIMEVNRREAVDINTYEDFRLAERLLDF